MSDEPIVHEAAGPVFVLSPEDYGQLRALCDRLHGGTDRERDEGHRLWLLLERVVELPPGSAFRLT